MVKIHLNNEKEILDFHYSNLTKQIGKEWTVIIRIEKLIKKYNRHPLFKSFYEYLLAKVEQDANGFSILTAKPEELKKFIEDIESKFSAFLQKPVIQRQLSNIFYYKEYDSWKAYELAKKIDVNVCPYCNRMYTFHLGTDKFKGTRFEYDHFYAKAKYPYLRLSFYNLIPSCHICNSNLKGKNEFSIDDNIHPYLEGFSSDIVFSIKPKNIQFINGNHSAYRIRFRKGALSKWDKEKIINGFRNISTFRLTELYNMHKDYVDEIIQKSIVYSPAYISGLYAQFHGNLFKSKEEVYRFVLGNYTNEFDYKKRVLSKLTTDISKELGLL